MENFETHLTPIDYSDFNAPSRKELSKPAAYALHHVESDLLYVGSTSNLYSRVASHGSSLRAGSHHNGALQKAFDENPVFNLKYRITPTMEEAVEIEQSLLDKLLPSGKLLNRAPDARSAGKGIVFSEERRSALRSATVRQFSDPANRERQSILSREKWQDPEYRAKQASRDRKKETSQSASDAMKLRWANSEYRERVLAARPKHILKTIVDGVEYRSIRAAASANNVDAKTMKSRILDDRYPEIYLKEGEQK